MKILRLFPAILALAAAGALPAIAATRPAGLPAGVVQISPCVATMGEHWANPKSLPLGPIYGVYQGKLVFSEIMVDQRLFAQGKGFRDVVKPLPGYTIDHVDITFNPHGHFGYTIPHYDIHAFYVPHSVHMAYCPNGIPDPASPL